MQDLPNAFTPITDHHPFDGHRGPYISLLHKNNSSSSKLKVARLEFRENLNYGAATIITVY